MTDKTIKYMNELKNQINGISTRLGFYKDIIYEQNTPNQADDGLILMLNSEMKTINEVYKILENSLFKNLKKENELTIRGCKDLCSELINKMKIHKLQSIQKSN